MAGALDRPLHRHRRVSRVARRVLGRLEPERGHETRRAPALDPAAEAPGLLDERLDRPARLELDVRLRGADERRAQQRDAAARPPARRGRRRRGGGSRRGLGGDARGRTLEPPRPSGRGLALAEAVSLDPRPQRVPRDPEECGGARDVPAGLLEHLRHAVAHGVVERARSFRARRRRRLLAGLAGEPERLGADLALVRQEDHALHQVPQLPDVARPRVRYERSARVGGEPLLRRPVVGARAGEEVLRQRQDIASPRAQRRQGQRQHRQPMIEVLAEPPRAHRSPEVLVRRGENPGVHRLVARGPEPPHRPLLEHLEELGLQRLGQEPDLVEEDRPAVRGLEEARLRAPRVRERAALEAEHLGLEEGLGDRRAVDVHERPVRARARAMDHPGQEPLAGSGLPFDQDRRQPADVLLALE